MGMERPNGTTMKGNPLTLLGPELKPGDKAPDFSARTQDLKPFTLNDTKGKIRLFSAVPSLARRVWVSVMTKRNAISVIASRTRHS